MHSFLSESQSHTGIGVMSGTSLDGLDLVLCRFQARENGHWSHEILHTSGEPYPKEWRNRLEKAHLVSGEDYAKLNVEYGHFLGERLRDFIRSCPEHAEFIASHGHTIFHQPEKAFTAQIGDGETIAAYLNVPLVVNFRNKDVALGGQGAPLVPFGEKHLFPECRLFLNLGGFSNLTAGDLAFDVSPCNFALNWAARRADPSLEFDPDGNLARSGAVDGSLLEKLNALEYYHLPPPRSLGREWFENEFLPILETTPASPNDLLHTLCRHIADQIGQAAELMDASDSQILITGGGARNAFLVEQILHALKPHGIAQREIPAELIDYKEALIFAFLGLHTLLGLPNILPSVTGARAAAVAGSVHLPGA